MHDVDIFFLSWQFRISMCWMKSLSILQDFTLINLIFFFPNSSTLSSWRFFLFLLTIKMKRKWILEDLHFIFFGVLCLLFIDGGKLEQVKRK